MGSTRICRWPGGLEGDGVVDLKRHEGGLDEHVRVSAREGQCNSGLLLEVWLSVVFGTPDCHSFSGTRLCICMYLQNLA